MKNAIILTIKFHIYMRKKGVKILQNLKSVKSKTGPNRTISQIDRAISTRLMNHIQLNIDIIF